MCLRNLAIRVYLVLMKYDHLVTTSEAAKMLHRSIRTVNRMARDGSLAPALKLPGATGAYMFAREDIEALAGASVT